jgi:hypothetical protein
MTQQEEAAEVSKASDMFHCEEDIEEVEVLAVDPLADEELCADDRWVLEVITRLASTLNLAEKRCEWVLYMFYMLQL